MVTSRKNPTECPYSLSCSGLDLRNGCTRRDLKDRGTDRNGEPVQGCGPVTSVGPPGRVDVGVSVNH